MNIIEQVIKSLKMSKFNFTLYNSIYEVKEMNKILIEQLEIIIKCRKKTTNLAKVFKKIVQIFVSKSEFRKGIVLIIKEIIIYYLHLINSKNQGMVNFIRNEFHEPTVDIIQILSNVFGYKIVIHTIKNKEIKREVFNSKISYKTKQMLQKSDDYEFFENIYQDGNINIFKDNQINVQFTYNLFLEKNFKDVCHEILKNQKVIKSPQDSPYLDKYKVSSNKWNQINKYHIPKHNSYHLNNKQNMFGKRTNSAENSIHLNSSDIPITTISNMYPGTPKLGLKKQNSNYKKKRKTQRKMRTSSAYRLRPNPSLISQYEKRYYDRRNNRKPYYTPKKKRGKKSLPIKKTKTTKKPPIYQISVGSPKKAEKAQTLKNSPNLNVPPNVKTTTKTNHKRTNSAHHMRKPDSPNNSFHQKKMKAMAITDRRKKDTLQPQPSMKEIKKTINYYANQNTQSSKNLSIVNISSSQQKPIKKDKQKLRDFHNKLYSTLSQLPKSKELALQTNLVLNKYHKDLPITKQTFNNYHKTRELSLQVNEVINKYRKNKREFSLQAKTKPRPWSLRDQSLDKIQKTKKQRLQQRNIQNYDNPQNKSLTIQKTYSILHKNKSINQTQKPSYTQNPPEQKSVFKRPKKFNYFLGQSFRKAPKNVKIVDSPRKHQGNTKNTSNNKEKNVKSSKNTSRKGKNKSIHKQKTQTKTQSKNSFFKQNKTKRLKLKTNTYYKYPHQSKSQRKIQQQSPVDTFDWDNLLSTTQDIYNEINFHTDKFNSIKALSKKDVKKSNSCKVKSKRQQVTKIKYYYKELDLNVDKTRPNIKTSPYSQKDQKTKTVCTKTSPQCKDQMYQYNRHSQNQ